MSETPSQQADRGPGDIISVELGAIISVQPGAIISVCPGSFVGIRSLGASE
jgi:hypothetical protein